jgi:tetraacyldisaccharide 4'-kinase
LNALSALYGGAAQLRRAWYERVPARARTLAQPVISVGNLVVGGSGKTPVVAALARLLLEKGERPSILSRGYGRRVREDGVLVVSTPERVLEPTARSGDEPQMLARGLPGVPVIVSPNRYLAGALAERRFGCTVHLLDDGYQHLQLQRDIDLLLVSKADLDEHLLPFGRLREPLAAAAAADALLVTGQDDDVEEVAAALGKDVAFLIVPHYGEAQPVYAVDAPAAGGRRAVAMAAIARPQRFFNAARAEGWDVVRELSFRDHHWFDGRDVANIAAAALDAGADVILTTEKDAMRLREHPACASPVWMYLPMEVVIESARAFRGWLGDRLDACRA